MIHCVLHYIVCARSYLKYIVMHIMYILLFGARITAFALNIIRSFRSRCSIIYAAKGSKKTDPLFCNDKDQTKVFNPKSYFELSSN